MAGFEYKVVPAPTKGVKAKGVKTAEARFSLSLEQLVNELAAAGWEYQRADTLPSTERSGLTGSQSVWRHVLVFRRARTEAPKTILKQEVTPVPDLIPEPEPAPEPIPLAKRKSPFDSDV